MAPERKSRRGSENRQRQRGIVVRVTGDELARIRAIAAASGLSVAALLRESALAREAALELTAGSTP